MNRVLVVAVHPDDETLGCGGTLLKHKAKGDEIFWLIATKMKEKDKFSKETIALRKTEVESVSKLYGFDGVHELGLSAAKVDEYPLNELIKRISKVIGSIKPDIIYLPFAGDAHSDHRIIFKAARNCTKTFRYPFVKMVLMMETISETEFGPNMGESAFIPNYFVDISQYFDKKIDILSIYKSELSEHPFPRNLENIKALATFRGSIAGFKYAESFIILKKLW